MGLTPLKIRGRGPRKKSFRPPERLDQGSRSARVLRRRGPHPLELLPLEILEEIVLLSENAELPRASLRLGYRLSSEIFLRRLLIYAFAPTWNLCYGSMTSKLEKRTRFHNTASLDNPEFQVCLYFLFSVVREESQQYLLTACLFSSPEFRSRLSLGHSGQDPRRSANMVSSPWQRQAAWTTKFSILKRAYQMWSCKITDRQCSIS
jgi:hypothetical protein